MDISVLTPARQVAEMKRESDYWESDHRVVTAYAIWSVSHVCLQEPVLWALPTRTMSRPLELQTSGIPGVGDDAEHATPTKVSLAYTPSQSPIGGALPRIPSNGSAEPPSAEVSAQAQPVTPRHTAATPLPPEAQAVSEAAEGAARAAAAAGAVLEMGASETGTDEGAVAVSPRASRSPQMSLSRSPLSCCVSPGLESLPGTVSDGGGLDVAIDGLASPGDEAAAG